MNRPILLPQPREFRTGGETAVPSGVRVVGSCLQEASLRFALGGFLSEDGVPVSIERDGTCGAEGYCLSVRTDGIVLRRSEAAGEFYGLLTLRQLLSQAENGKIACAEIRDEPDLRVRGLMLDISRNKIPTTETLKKTVDFLAALKINQFQLYIEGKSFRYPSLEKFYGADCDVLTASDVAELDAYCKERFVEFVPNQNCFGHMSEWLAEEELNPLAECPERFSFYGVRTPASTLNPEDGNSFRFVKRQLDDLIPLFASGSVNIGGDEPFELGEGKSGKACARIGKGGVYLEFMKKIFSVVQSYGRNVMMWGDVFKEYYRQYRDSFPQDVTILEWGYNADSFTDDVCALYRDAGLRYCLCPGTSLWNTVTGKTEVMRENVRSAARLGKKHGAEGILLVDWGDGGTCQPLVCTRLSYATGAAYAWNTGAEQETEIARYLDRFEFLDGSGTFANLLAELGNYYLCADRDDANATKVFKTLYVQQTDCMNVDEGNFEPLFTNRDFERMSARECLKTLEYLEKIESRLGKVRMEHAEGKVYLREFEWAVGYLKHGCKLGAIKAENRQFTARELRALSEEIERLNAEYEEIWNLRNRRTGLRQSMMRMRALARKYGAILGDGI